MKSQDFKRSDLEEWTLFEVTNQHFPVYMKFSTVERIGDKVAVMTRLSIDPATPLGQKYPDAAYSDDLTVLDCKQPRSASAETTIVGKEGETVFHYKWADPQFLDLSIGTAVGPGTVLYSLGNIVCYERFQTPLFGKTERAAMKLTSVASTTDGNGDFFFVPSPDGRNAQN